MLKISRLTVEHLAKACVTDCEHPRVSFQLESDRENVTLDHAVIRIGDWSVETDAQILIPYEGKQLMPFTEDAVIDKLEENVKKLPSVTTMLEEGETPEGMIRRVLDGFDVEFYEETPTGYVCDCSKERVERAIISIGKKEIQDMIDDQKPIEVNCHFCGRHYEFSVDDLKHLLKKAVRA